VEVLKAEQCTYPSNEPDHESGAKAHDKCVNGTLQFMDECKLVGVPMMGMIQGGCNDKMREWSLEQTMNRGVSSFMLCGLGRISSFEEVLRVVRLSIAKLPKEKMKFCQGSFTAPQVVQLIREGVDCVTSVYPIEKANAGVALSFPNVEIDLNDAKHMLDKSPIDTSCACFTCRKHSRGYICHLLATKEMLATSLITIHNLYRFYRLFKRIRECLYTNKSLETIFQ
jgi:queuine tRNA-ribosyltransferase